MKCLNDLRVCVHTRHHSISINQPNSPLNSKLNTNSYFALNHFSFGSYNYNQNQTLKMSEHSESKASVHPSGFQDGLGSGADRASRGGAHEQDPGINPFTIP